jgi:hypothetical protein
VAATPSIRFNISSPYEGGTKTWSTRFHFSGGVPANLTDWTSLMNDIKGGLQPGICDTSTIVSADCLVAGTDVPLHTINIGTAGTFPVSGNLPVPLHMCALVRWSTDARTSKNHPIYLFNYLHATARKSGSNIEHVDDNLKSNVNTYLCNAFTSGFTVAGVTYRRAGPNGAVALDGHVEDFLSHRDFPK